MSNDTALKQAINLGDKRRPANFRELYGAWIATLSTQKLNKDFYQQLAWWYGWPPNKWTFPSAHWQA